MKKAMTLPIWKTPLLTVVGLLAVISIIASLLLVPTGAYMDSIEEDFNEHGISWNTIIEIGWDTRWYIGRFRNPPTDKEMIAYLNQHRTDFDHLADAYYKAISKDIYKTGGFDVTTADLKPLLRSLNLWNADPDGALLQPNFGKQAPVFTDMGVSFPLLDSGAYPWWRLGRKYIKSYLYMPDIPPYSGASSDPTVRLLSTRDYVVEADTDHPEHPILAHSCAVRQIDNHWFIQNCDANTVIHKP